MRRPLATFFAVDDPWERPGTLTGVDVLVGLVTLAFSAVTFELTRSTGLLQDVTEPAWVQWLAVVLGAALLVPRRRFPLSTALLAATHMFVVGVTMVEVMGQLCLQVVYFVAFFSAVAWARSRRDMLLVMGLISLFVTAWLAWEFAAGSGLDSIRRSLGEDAGDRFGQVSPVAASVLLTAAVNALYFGGATVAGQLAWRGARQRERLAALAGQLAEQAESVQRRAVLEERLRIARELHDVVAHHVSVIGIQAAAGRRVLDRDPVATAAALGQIEQSSREAVTQMRGLLGTLRSPEDVGAAVADRSPEPGVADLPGLVESQRTPGFEPVLELVEDEPGLAGRLPGPVGLTLYRAVQEALANIARHSTATRARVVLRVAGRGGGPGFAEVEVVDDGRPRAGTSGSGLGQLGIRERVASLSGEVEIGPRPSGGYRVRVRLPLSSAR